ncbi:unnamed protein product, partial [Rotaria sp. Silwood2]
MEISIIMWQPPNIQNCL